jgi:DNA-binding response OmpR family regulator
MKDILIVEDGAEERQRLTRVLSEAGYQVDASESVGGAEEAVSREQYRLVILDIGLSDRSGSVLFHSIRKIGKVQNVIIFTGNPSSHLKQRFLDEGAADYIVKGSPAASNENFLRRVQELLGIPKTTAGGDGVDLRDFIRAHLDASSQRLFLEADDQFAPCPKCSGVSYVVSFKNRAQVPPQIVGVVLCAGCGAVMDPEVG